MNELECHYCGYDIDDESVTDSEDHVFCDAACRADYWADRDEA